MCVGMCLRMLRSQLDSPSKLICHLRTSVFAALEGLLREGTQMCVRIVRGAEAVFIVMDVCVCSTRDRLFLAR